MTSRAQRWLATTLIAGLTAVAAPAPAQAAPQPQCAMPDVRITVDSLRAAAAAAPEAAGRVQVTVSVLAATGVEVARYDRGGPAGAPIEIAMPALPAGVYLLMVRVTGAECTGRTSLRRFLVR